MTGDVLPAYTSPRIQSWPFFVASLSPQDACRDWPERSTQLIANHFRRSNQIYRLNKSSLAFAMQHCEGKSRQRLTENRADPTLSLPGPSRDLCCASPGKLSATGLDESRIPSRNVSVLLHCAAGVCRGIDSKSSSEPRPTRQQARWVFVFRGMLNGTGGEVVNALVCKTDMRGFESRPVLQSS